MSELIVVRRSRPQNFTVLDNAVLRDRNLSWKAKGLFGFLSSCSSSYRLTIRRLAEQAGDGRESTMSAVRELQRCGYLEIERLRGAGGRFVSTTWIIKNPADRAPEVAPSRVADEKQGAPSWSSDSGRERHSPPKVREPGSDHERHSRIVASDHKRDFRIVDGDHERENRVLVTPSSTTEVAVQSISTTTNNGVVAESEFHFQDGLHQAERAEMLKLVRRYPQELAQQLLDEVADYANAEIKSSRVGLLASLAGKAERGEFRFARGAAVAKKREARRADAARQAITMKARQEQRDRAAQPPSATALASIERVRELFGERA
jgi:hypothetical protein